MSKFNPVIIFANAYDCKPVIEALEKINCDQLHINYYPYPTNYHKAEEFLEEHPEYSHLFYVAPDIVLDEFVWDMMCQYVKENDPAVYGCCCNVDTDKYSDSLACCLTLPTLEYETRNYRWLKESQRQDALSRGWKVIPVKFNANLAFVKTSIKKCFKYMSIPVQKDVRPIHEQEGGFACDLALCHQFDYSGIEVLVDLRYKVKHLRYAGELLVGKITPNTKFIKKHKAQNVND